MDKEDLLSYPTLNAFDDLFAFTTTRQNMEENIPGKRYEKHKKAEMYREQLAPVLDIPQQQILFPEQTHSANVYIVDDLPESEIASTDAMVTNRPGYCLCVQTADCVPVLLFDPVKRVVAAVHAGWRGTVSGLVSKTIDVMVDHFSVETKSVHVAMGPCISQPVYEVGEEVAREVMASVPNADSVLQQWTDDKFLLDLRGANTSLLLERNIPLENIAVSSACTYLDNDQFYSARKEGISAGRLVSGIMLTR